MTIAEIAALVADLRIVADLPAGDPARAEWIARKEALLEQADD